MKKIILLLLIANSSPNLFCAAQNQLYEINKIQNQFSKLLELQDFDAIESFIIKNIDYINKPGDYNDTMITIAGFQVNWKKNKTKDDFTFKVIKLLLQLGADILHIYSIDKTIFHDAPDLAIKAVEEIEKERKELSDSLLYETPLPKEIIDIVQSYQSEKQPQLMNHPILNARSEHERTPLHSQGCFGNNRPAGIKLLVEYRADLEAKDANGATPIFYAIQGYPEVLKAMIELKADLNHKDYDKITPLERAIKISRREMAQILKDAMAQKDKMKKVEKTISHCCVIQ